MACHIICFVSFRFVSFRFVSFRFDLFRFVLFRFVSICFVSFRSVSFRFDLFRFVSICFVSFRFVSVSFRTLQGPCHYQEKRDYKNCDYRTDRKTDRRTDPSVPLCFTFDKKTRHFGSVLLLIAYSLISIKIRIPGKK